MIILMLMVIIIINISVVIIQLNRKIIIVDTANTRMKITRGCLNVMKLTIRNRYNFCKKTTESNQDKQIKEENRFFKFIKDGWRQTFPQEEDEVKRKYEKVKNMKRYTEEQLKQMQDKIPQYQRTSLVQTQQKQQQKKSKFKISNLIPQSIKQKLKQTNSYKQFSEFKENLKQFVTTSDSTAVNLGTRAYKAVSEASSATDTMRKYDKEFSVLQLQKQSTFLFKQAYQYYLAGNVQALQLLCGQNALNLFKTLLKINQQKKQRPKYTQILHYRPARWKQTVMKQQSMPSFVFSMELLEIYCMVDASGSGEKGENGEVIEKVVDGDQDRMMESTYHFVVKYSGQHIAQLGHPWKIIEFAKVNQVKMLM